MDSSVLAINTGSSSIKFVLYGDEESILLRGRIEGIESASPVVRVFAGDGSLLKEEHAEGLGFAEGALRLLELVEQAGYRGSIKAVGHRVVHGGLKYREHTLLTPELVDYLKQISHLAPEHLPQSIEVMEGLSSFLEDIPQVACFDTAFHKDMPIESTLYAIPFEFYQEGVVRYGFHGLSYEYIVEELASSGEPLDRVIVAHLGHGASLAAIREGRCVHTTMGFTPTAGVVMSTRCGDIDPGVVVYLMKNSGFSADELNRLLNHRSGMLGISGISDDIKVLIEREAHEQRAALAIRVFCHSVRAYIGSLCAMLGGLSTVVFTAGIGENSPTIRERILKGLEFLGIRLDGGRNQRGERVVSTDNSPVRVLVIKTDEERMILRHTLRILKNEGR